MNQTPLPEAELELFKFIAPDLKVIFDVGARIDVDYALLLPESECHLFEPSPEFYPILTAKVNEQQLNAVVNPYGIGDQIGEFCYSHNIQSFRDSNPIYKALPVKTIDWYCKEFKISHIDFLKTDTEGWDYKVIEGGRSMWPKIKYIQYEHWNDDERYRELLKDYFEFEYIGYRNGLCMSKTLLSEARRQEVVKFIRDNKFGELA